MKFAQCIRALRIVLLLSPGMCDADPRTDVIEFHIPAQTLEKSLREFRLQAPGVSLLMPGEIALGGMAPAVDGRYTMEAALTRLLQKSTVTATFVPPSTFTLHGESPHDAAATRVESDEISEVVLRGSRRLNADQRRTQDDSFAYFIFDDKAIERSAWPEARSFLTAELPAISARGVALGAAAITGAGGQIAMRGLPSSETLILFDGHRRAGTFAGGDVMQPDVSMTPLSFLGRIEVRTGSASAFFGSDATTGAINFIRDRRTPRTHFFIRAEELTGVSAGTQQLSAEHVMVLAHGSGWLAIDGALLRQEAITLGRRNFVTGGRQRTLSNYPGAYDDASTPPLASLRNLHATGTQTFRIKDGVRYVYLPEDYRKGDDLSASAGQYDLTLAPSAQVLGEFSTLRPARDVYSLSAAGGWEISERFSVDLDAGFAESLREGRLSALDGAVNQAFFVAADHPANPLKQDLWASRGTNIADGPMSRRDQSIYGTLVTTWLFSDDATLRLDDAWSTSSATIRQPVLKGDTSGLIGLLMGPAPDAHMLSEAGMWLDEESSPRYANDLNEATLSFTHSQVMLPAGAATVTLTAQHLLEKTADPAALDSAGSPLAAQRAQRTLSFAASTNVPLLKARAEKQPARVALDVGLRRDSVAIRAAPEATVQRALRFITVSRATGLRWQVIDPLTVRLGCTTGFLPPPLSSISDQSPAYLEDLHLTDPARGNEPLDAAEVIAGGNYDLRPERFRACGGGFILGDAEDDIGQEHWRLSMDYTRSVRTGGVRTPADLFFLDPQKYLSAYPDRIVRASPGGAITGIQTWSINSARQEIESIDIQFGWSGPLSTGNLGISFIGSVQPVSTHRFAPSMSRENDAGIGNLASPVWRGMTALTWKSAEFALGLNARYTSPYDVSRVESIQKSQGNENVASQIYVDLYAAYTLPKRFPGDTELRLDARNILHRDPPADLGETGYASRFGLEEFASLSLSVNVRL